jgi:hypothetical protein
LESYASSLGGSGGGGAAASSASSGSGGASSPALRNFDDFVAASVNPFVAAASKFPETKKVAEGAQKAFAEQRNVIEATASCKKPSDAEFGKLLGPLGAVISSADFNDNRHPFFNHLKAWAEAANALGWVSAPPPTRQFVSDAGEAADFYINKVLLDSKKKSGQEAADHAAYATTLKALLKALAEYCLNNFRAGLEWNPKVRRATDRLLSAPFGCLTHMMSVLYTMCVTCAFH